MSQSTQRRVGAHLQGGVIAANRRVGTSPLHRLAAWLGLSQRASAREPRSPRFAAIDACAAFRRGDEFLQRCRQERVPVGVLVFELHDLPELECVFGSQAAHSAIEHAATRLQRIAGTAGKVLRTDLTVFTVLLPDLDKVDIEDMVREAFGQSCALELEAGGEDLVLVPDFAVRILSTETSPLVDVQHGLCCEIQEARAREQRRRDYLQRERESHSRPMPLPRPAAPRRATRPDSYPPIPMTIPVPLRAR